MKKLETETHTKIDITLTELVKEAIELKYGKETR